MTDGTHDEAAASPGAPALREEVLRYYSRGEEDGRLRSGMGRLEYLRTQDLLRRLLPATAIRILDVGGGSGVHARWLAEEDGHQVELIDPVPLHVEQAALLPGVTARLGDARALPLPDGCADAVLLLGPLYHLTRRRQRVRALAEARRVLCPGGLVIAASINRFSALHDQLGRGAYFEPGERQFIDSVNDSGRHHRGDGGFDAYLHEPAEVLGEFGEAGLVTRGQYGVEGAVWLMPDALTWLADDYRRDAVLDALRRTESVPSLLGVSAHLLTVGSV